MNMNTNTDTNDTIFNHDNKTSTINHQPSTINHQPRT